MTLALQDIQLTRPHHAPASLADYAGSVVLVVNVASKCGLTKQYEGLQKLYQTYHPQDVDVLAFPCNQFAGQEPGTDEEIATFCSTHYNVDFPIFAKTEVNGPDAHPLYQALKAAQPSTIQSPDGKFKAKMSELGYLPKQPTDIMWNFEKFLIDRSGKVIARFAPDIDPLDPQIIKAIETALKQ